jgi:hypothetical protein
VTAASEEQVRELAVEILSRSPYAGWRQQPRLEWLHGLLQAIERFFMWLNALADTRPVLYAALMLVLLAAALGLIAHLVYTIRLALRAGTDTATVAPPSPLTRLAEDAAQLAAAGRYLDAAHHMQLAVIELLLQRGIVELSRSEPNRTLRERIRGATLPPHEQHELVRLLDTLERHWFRDRRADHSLYEAWCLLHARLRALPGVA